MDPHTLELLEFPKIRELLAGNAATALGKELARQLTPGTNLHDIRERLALVTEMTETLAAGESPPFGGLHDVRLLARRAAIGSMLTAGELLEVKDTLACTGAMYRWRMRLDPRWEGLINLLARVEDLGVVAKTIEGCIDARGDVLDMASPELAAVRRHIAELDERAQNQIKRLLRDPELRKALRFTNATVSGDHYLLPVSVNYRHRLPGIVHRTSSTGETVFIEPAGVAALSAERAVLRAEEEKEIQRVLRRLTAEVARVSRPLHNAVETLAELDLVYAKSRYSRDFHMAAPDLSAESKVWLRQARHPVLESLFRGDDQGRQVMPIDVRLGLEFNFLIVTGPNTGGKTVALKTVGLLALMAQCAMHVPAGQASMLPIFDHVLADIGDEQSLEQSLSTFSSHISRIADILATATKQSLVLLDELGAGTDPTEGAALSRAILDELDRIGCRAIVTTHLGDLKTYAFTNDHAENAAVEFNVETFQPTYRLLTGQFGMSNALKIARKLRLPRELLRRAHRYLRRRQRRGPELEKLQQAREEAEQARVEALRVQDEARRERAAYEQKRGAMEREAEEAAALDAARAQLQIGDAVRLTTMDRTGVILRIDHDKKKAIVMAGIGQWEVRLEEITPSSKTLGGTP